MARRAAARRRRAGEISRAVRNDPGRVVAADSGVGAGQARQQPHCSAAIVLDGLGGIVIWRCHWSGSIIATRVTSGLSSISISPEFRRRSNSSPLMPSRAGGPLIDKLCPFLGAQLADFVVGSSSHCKRSLEGSAAWPAP